MSGKFWAILALLSAWTLLVSWLPMRADEGDSVAEIAHVVVFILAAIALVSSVVILVAIGVMS